MSAGPRVALALTTLLLTASPALTARWDDCHGWDDEGPGRGHYCEIRQLDLPAAGQLDVVASPNGGITVGGEDRSDVEVRARVTAHGRDEAEARQLAAEVEIVAEGGSIRSHGPQGNWSVSYRIAVPRATDLDLEARNGGIDVHSVSGEMEIETLNGGLSLSDLGGRVRARTTNGGVDVRLDGDRWQGDSLEVVTTNGGVELQIPHGYNAELETSTVNGRLVADTALGVSPEARSHRLSATLGDGGPRVAARTTNGGVRLRGE